MAKLVKVEAQANTLKTARNRLEKQVPPDATVVIEKIVGAKSAVAIGESEDIAYREAEKQMPQGAEILARRLLASPTLRTTIESASDTEAAQVSIQGKLEGGETIRGVRTIEEPRAGFLGIGRRHGSYEVDVLRPAKCAVTYVVAPKLIAWVGDSRAKPIVEAVKAWYRKSAGGRVGGGTCDDCNDGLTLGNTYLRPGGYLCCEACTDTFLASYVDWAEAVKNLNGAIGPGVPSSIQELASEVWK